MPIHAPFLRYFAEVARSGSVRLAASRLFVSSSAVNRQILKIEHELDTRLFDRTRSGMRLTAAGQLLLDHVERTLGEAERCLEAIAALDAAAELAPVTVAAQESVIGRFLAPVLVRFHVASPGSCSAFRAAGGHELQRLLVAGEADIAVVFDAADDAAIERLGARDLLVGAIVDPAHPLAARESVTLAECAAFPLILPDASWPLRALLDERLGRLETMPQILSTSNSVEFLRTMVDRRLGVGFQTVVGIEDALDAGELVQVALHDPEPVRQSLGICIARGGRRDEPLETLARLLVERLDDYVERWGS